MRKPSALELARLWVELNPAAVGMTVGVIMVLGVLTLTIPLQAQPASGTVEQLIASVSKRGLRYRAWVVVAGRRVSVGLTPPANCRAGDRIELVRMKYLWRVGYVASVRACAA